MILGVVVAQEALIHVTVQGPLGQEQEVETTIDTGYTGYLTLPRPFISSLGLDYHSHTVATLADGHDVRMAVYDGAVLWDGQKRDVWILEADGGCLLGMSLLEGFRLNVDVVDGGAVTVETLP